MLRRYQYKGVSNEDINMEGGPSSSQQDEEDDDDDGDDVPQLQVTIVNEADLEGSSKILLLKAIVDSDIL